MRNRLDELQQIHYKLPSSAFEDKDASRLAPFQNLLDRVGLLDQDKGWEGRDSASESMQAFFREVSEIKRHIDSLKDTTESIQAMRLKAARATTSQQEKEISSEVAMLIQRAGKDNLRCKQNLEALKCENQKFEEEFRLDRPSEVKIRDTLYATTVKKFQTAVSQYQEAQIEFKNQQTSKVERTVRIVYPHASDEEVETLVAAGPTAVLESRISKSENMQEALWEMQDKYQEIKQLQQSVQDLFQLNQQLAELVTDQGHVIDQIESQVNDSRDYVEAAQRNLMEARRLKAARDRRTMIILLIVVLLVCGFVFWIVRSVRKWMKRHREWEWEHPPVPKPRGGVQPREAQEDGSATSVEVSLTSSYGHTGGEFLAVLPVLQEVGKRVMKVVFE